jgi:hypothetical protein
VIKQASEKLDRQQIIKALRELEDTLKLTEDDLQRLPSSDADAIATLALQFMRNKIWIPLPTTDFHSCDEKKDQ